MVRHTMPVTIASLWAHVVTSCPLRSSQSCAQIGTEWLSSEALMLSDAVQRLPVVCNVLWAQRRHSKGQSRAIVAFGPPSYETPVAMSEHRHWFCSTHLINWVYLHFRVHSTHSTQDTSDRAFDAFDSPQELLISILLCSIETIISIIRESKYKFYLSPKRNPRISTECAVNGVIAVFAHLHSDCYIFNTSSVLLLKCW